MSQLSFPCTANSAWHLSENLSEDNLEQQPTILNDEWAHVAKLCESLFFRCSPTLNHIKHELHFDLSHTPWLSLMAPSF